MKKFFFTAALAATAMGFTACSNEDVEGQQGMTGEQVLSIDGTDNVYTIANAENANWQIVDCPGWVTPIKMAGSASEAIEVYVESNQRQNLRTGDIVVEYGNGQTHATRAEQNNKLPETFIKRSYAAGWSFDARTYADYRGLRQQIFNAKRLEMDGSLAYRVLPQTSTSIDYFYGTNESHLQRNINAKLKIDGNFNAFSLDLNGNFGKSSLSSEDRVFSWMRSIFIEQVATMTYDEDDEGTAYFTEEFKSMRQTVIDEKGSDSAIKFLIEAYGTHYVHSASLGGSLNYYYSTVNKNHVDSLGINGVVKAGYGEKFKVNGDATYLDKFKEMNDETIEKIEVKGGDAMMLVRCIESGTMHADSLKVWTNTLKSGQVEMISFELTPIAALFPDDISLKITNYLNKLYYQEMPLTRSSKK